MDPVAAAHRRLFEGFNTMTLADPTATMPFRPSSAENTDAAAEPRAQRPINVGADERKISAIAGGALALVGLSRRSLPGLALAALGGAMVYRGVTGHCDLYAALGIDTHDDAPPEPHEYFEHGIHVEHSIT